MTTHAFTGPYHDRTAKTTLFWPTSVTSESHAEVAAKKCHEVQSTNPPPLPSLEPQIACPRAHSRYMYKTPITGRSVHGCYPSMMSFLTSLRGSDRASPAPTSLQPSESNRVGKVCTVFYSTTSDDPGVPRHEKYFKGRRQRISDARWAFDRRRYTRHRGQAHVTTLVSTSRCFRSDVHRRKLRLQLPCRPYSDDYSRT